MRRRLLLCAVLGVLAAGCSGGGSGDDDDDSGATPGDPLDGEWLAGFALPGPSGFGAQVFTALVTTDGATVVAGTFGEIGGTPVANVARFDGATWTAMGTSLPEGVRALAIDSAGTLIAGGDFPNLYAFDGAEWNARAGEIVGSVGALAAQNGSLLVGGAFDDAGGSGAASLARYDEGAWSAIDGADVIGTVRTVFVVDAGSFCIGGAFTDVGATPAANVACEEGGTWAQLGDGVPGEVNVLTRDLAGDWIAGGTLTYVIDAMTGEYEAGLAKLTGGTWAPLAGGIDGGFINDVRAIHVATSGDLVVGGTFEEAGTLGVPASNLARLSGASTWSEVGGGVDNLVGVFLGSAIGVNVIVPRAGGELLVGGVFSHAGGAVATNVAVTNAGELEATVPEADAIGGLSGFADAVAFHPDGSVIVAGSFAGAGHLPVANVARYAEGAWSPLGAGIDDGIVRALAILDDGTIIAGGDFSSLRRYQDQQWEPYAPGVENVFALLADGEGRLYAAGDFDEYVKRWNGEEWESLDGGLDSRPTSLTFDDRGRLVAGGLFTTGSGVTLNGLGRYSGGEWHGYSGGLTNGGYVSDVEVLPDGDLVIAGSFDEVGGVAADSLAILHGGEWEAIASLPVVIDVEPYGDGFFLTGIFETLPGGEPAGYIAWFDGEEFHPLGEGLSDIAEEIHVQGTRLWCGGSFVNAGGRVSSGVAVWSFTPGP